MAGLVSIFSNFFNGFFGGFFGGYFQDLFRIVPGFFRDLGAVRSGSSQYSLMDFFWRIVSGLFQDHFRIVSGLFQDRFRILQGFGGSGHDLFKASYRIIV